MNVETVVALVLILCAVGAFATAFWPWIKNDLRLLQAATRRVNTSDCLPPERPDWALKMARSEWIALPAHERR